MIPFSLIRLGFMGLVVISPLNFHVGQLLFLPKLLMSSWLESMT